jgi:hypothetical protein
MRPDQLAAGSLVEADGPVIAFDDIEEQLPVARLAQKPGEFLKELVSQRRSLEVFLHEEVNDFATIAYYFVRRWTSVAERHESPRVSSQARLFGHDRRRRRTSCK